MSFSYSGDPSASTVDQVRFLIQDTTDPCLISDEEIAWLLTEETNAYAAAVAACRTLAVRYAGKQGSRSIGDVSVSYSDITTTYLTLVRTLESEAIKRSPATPYLGGLSQADKDLNDTNTDHSERMFDDEDFPLTTTEMDTLPGNPPPY